MAGDNKNKKKEAPKKGGPVKKKRQRQIWTLYEVKGETLTRKNKFSPKSSGDFLAQHKDRVHCGKTGYTEFTSK